MASGSLSGGDEGVAMVKKSATFAVNVTPSNNTFGDAGTPAVAVVTVHVLRAGVPDGSWTGDVRSTGEAGGLGRKSSLIIL